MTTEAKDAGVEVLHEFESKGGYPWRVRRVRDDAWIAETNSRNPEGHWYRPEPLEVSLVLAAEIARLAARLSALEDCVYRADFYLNNGGTEVARQAYLDARARVGELPEPTDRKGE